MNSSKSPLLTSSPLFRFFTVAPLNTLRQRLVSNLGMAVGWALMGGTAALFLAERIPNFRRDFFCKLPVIGDYWAEYRVTEEAEEGGE